MTDTEKKTLRTPAQALQQELQRLGLSGVYAISDSKGRVTANCRIGTMRLNVVSARWEQVAGIYYFSDVSAGVIDAEPDPEGMQVQWRSPRAAVIEAVLRHKAHLQKTTEHQIGYCRAALGRLYDIPEVAP